jgi:3-methyladenine DNA glycosylase AlkD
MDQLNSRTIEAELAAIGDPEIAAHSQRFFKTGPGEYGEGDKFLGIRVPELRKLAQKHRDLELDETATLLTSAWHEARLLALLIMVVQFKRGDDVKRETIFTIYLGATEHINNWDLVDSSAHLIVGPYLQDRDRAILQQLAHSASLWERRIAIMATFHYIRADSFGDTLDLSRILLHDPHDLIHKAVGWMLREVGKREYQLLVDFLDRHYRTMPRTMLRYAIEKLDQDERQAYLKGTARVFQG